MLLLVWCWSSQVWGPQATGPYHHTNHLNYRIILIIVVVTSDILSSPFYFEQKPVREQFLFVKLS